MAKTSFYTTMLCGIFFACSATAQQPAYTYYSIRNGLPSNDIYNCTEDKKGFLWIATENGLAKFDGKNFKTYTTAQGLPDNEILDVQTDSAGIIWVLPFQRNPAYYDERSDRFINSDKDRELEKISLTTVNRVNPIPGNGMVFYNSKGGIFIYRDKHCDVFTIPKNHGYLYPAHRVIGIGGNSFISVSFDSLRLWQNKKITAAHYLGRDIYYNAFANGNLYAGDSSRLVKIAVRPDGSTGQVKENRLPFKIASLNFTGSRIAITSVNGNAYLADTATLEFTDQAFSFNALIRQVYEDKAGNTWICTKESGLIRYQQKGILTLGEADFQRNFNTLAFYNNALVAGTNDGRLFYYKGPYDYREKVLLREKIFTGWIRKIIPFRGKLYIASEGALYILNEKAEIVKQLNHPFNATKDLFFVNDTLMIKGSSSFAVLVNPLTEKIIHKAYMRVTSLSASSAEEIYIGSNSGLYKLSEKKTIQFLGDREHLLSNRVSALAYNRPDNILWVGLATDTLVGLLNDRPVVMIPLGVNLPGNICRSLYSVKKGIVWVGTNKALARVNYNIRNGTLFFSTSVFTTADGIAGKQINDITERNDTVYVATTGGISILPAALRYNAPDIPVYISSVKINNADTLLQHEYNLGWSHNNISVVYTATDLAAATERIYEYRINNGNWITTKNDNIELQQLSPGKYVLQVRTLKRDGQPSSNTAEVIFRVSTPFWKSWIFYTMLFIFILILLSYVIQKRSRKKRELSVQQLLTEKRLSDLELKALKAQINPHFVFNCLNSIKYLNHRKRFDETEKYLDKFSFLLRRTLDFSGVQQISLHEELEYSKNYLELEKLRMGEKMAYEIITDPAIDTDITLVPPMLFQPYLENAVKHGIRHLKEKNGKIVICIEQRNGAVICNIKDNGIGMEKAGHLNRVANPGHLSRGNTLQERRAVLYGVEVSMVENVSGGGTVVMLTLNGNRRV